MIKKPSGVDETTMRRAAEFTRIGNEAVHQAQDDARRAGVPPVYSINGILHWELPDGSLTTEDPWQGKDTPPQA
ncbi:MAG: hypothetical protein AAGJ46_19685 [Planctomycetota bacterium]